MAKRLNFVNYSVALFGLLSLSISCAQPPSLAEYKAARDAASQDANPDANPESIGYPPDFDPTPSIPGTIPKPGPTPSPTPGNPTPGNPTPGNPTPGNPTPGNPTPMPVPAPLPAPGGVTPSSNPLIPAGRGAQVPWIEFQAEDGKTNATVIGPSRERYTSAHIEAEAIGRKAVRLAKTGDYVSVVTAKAANSIVVRLSVPDSTTGGGQDYTIGVYINGMRVKSLKVTSRYSWVYDGESLQTPNAPGGQPHVFFDEARALIDNIPAGAEVKLQKDEGDTAEFYVIDLIDLEQVGAPLTKPAESISVVDYGATPDDASDDGLAFQMAIDDIQGKNAKASATKKTLWIPKGTFIINSLPDPKGLGLSLKGLTIEGAGMWHSVIKGTKAEFYCWGDGGCGFKNFAMLGEVDRRDDNSPDNGFNGGLGTNTFVDGVWVEHYKVGMWVGTDRDPNGTNDLKVTNSRFRNTYGDGVNFDNGTSGSLIENSHFRNTGDDAVALWSIKKFGDRVNKKNVVKNVTVQMPWRANCFAVYGGEDSTIQDSVCEDVLTYSGLLFGNEFESHPFSGSNVAKNITLIRAGGIMFNQQYGSLRFNSFQGPVENVAVQNIDIIDSTFSGIHFQGNSGAFRNVSVKGANVSGSGTFGVQASGNPSGKASMESVIVKTSASKALELSGTPDSFFERLAGNSGW